MKRPYLILALVAGGALAYSLLKTVKAGVNLDYKLRKFQIYQFIKGNMLVFRLTMRIINPNATPIHVQMIDLDCYYEPEYTEEEATIKVNKKGSLIGSVVDVDGFTIPENNYIDKEIFIECKWLDLAKILTTAILDIIQNQENVLEYFLNKKMLIDGFVKAENFKIPITNVISVTD